MLEQSNFLLVCSCLIYLNPHNYFCAPLLFPCEFLIRAFSRPHRHPPPLQQTPNQRPPNLLNKHKQWEQKAMPPLQAKRHKIQSLRQVWNAIAPILMRRIRRGLFLEIPLRLDKPVSCAVTCIFHQLMETYLQRNNYYKQVE